MSSFKWRPDPEGAPKASAASTPGEGSSVAGSSDPLTLVEQLAFSTAPKPFKNPNFANRAMSKRNRSLKQIVTTEREAALGLITSGKRKGKKPTAAELAAAAAIAAGEQPVVKAPFEFTVKGPGGRQVRLVGAAARAAQARYLRERKQAQEQDGEEDEEEGGQGEDSKATNTAAGTREGSAEPGEGGESATNGIAPASDESKTELPSAAVGAEEESKDVVMEDAQAQASAAGTETPAATSVQAPVAVVPPKPRRDAPTYFSVDAPPSLRPRKHYCDITGLLGPYTDPKTRLRYHNAEIYNVIRRFGPGVDQQYLALRGDANAIK